MPLIKNVRGFEPQIGNVSYLADNATIIGDTVRGDNCNVWFNTVIRDDVNSIRIGNRVNIQDGAVLHCLYEKSVITIGDNVSIGHNVIIHGARISDYVHVRREGLVPDICLTEVYFTFKKHMRNFFEIVGIIRYEKPIFYNP